MKKTDKLIVKNAIFLLTRTLILTLIGLWTVREVLHALGVEGYGLFNLIFGLVTLFAFVNGALISSTQRFLSYKIGKSDNKGIRDSFISSILLHLIIAVIVCLTVFLLKDVFFYKVLNIGRLKQEANYLYILAIINIFIALSLIVLLVDSLSSALITGIQATGRIKIYQIVVGITLMLNVPISYFLIEKFNFEFIVYFVAFLISLICLIMRLKFVKNLLNFNMKNYVDNVIKPVLKIILYVIIVYLFYVVFIKGKYGLVMSSLFILFLELVVIMVIFHVGLTNREKEYILNKLMGLKR